MARYDWNTFASAVATFTQQRMATVPRGAFLIRCLGDGGMIAAVFGNDNYVADPKVRRELDVLRQRLHGSSATELAIGLSPDGRSWALLVRTDDQHFQTTAGRTFHTEMLKAFLEEAVESAWDTACGRKTPDPDRGLQDLPQNL